MLRHQHFADSIIFVALYAKWRFHGSERNIRLKVCSIVERSQCTLWNYFLVLTLNISHSLQFILDVISYRDLAIVIEMITCQITATHGINCPHTHTLHYIDFTQSQLLTGSCKLVLKVSICKLWWMKHPQRMIHELNNYSKIVKGKFINFFKCIL